MNLLRSASGRLFFIACCLASSQVWAQEQDLTGYWTFDEGTGTSLLDYSGHNGTGTLFGKAEWKEGKFGKCLYFPGTNGSYVDIPDGDWNRGAPFTVMLWYKQGYEANDHPPGFLLSHLEGGDSGRFGLYLAGGQYMVFSVWDTAHLERQNRKEEPERSVGEQMLDPEWVHLAFTVGAKELKFYKNGVLKQTREIKSVPSSRGRLLIGTRGEDCVFKGWIDEVAVFGRDLSAAEIQKIHAAYQSGVPGIVTKSAPEVVHVAAEKLHYSPDEKGGAKVVLKNFSGRPQEARLSVKLRTLLETDREIHASTVRLESNATVMREIPLTFGAESYGCLLLASLEIGGKSETRSSPPFSVSDNLWKVAIGGTFHPANLGLMNPGDIPRALDRLQSTFANYTEVYFWAPDDWGNMNPQAEWWYGGQAGYFVQKKNLKEWIRQSHERGLKVSTYGKACVASAADGAEVSRRHPEWFRRMPNGSLIDEGGSAQDFDRWNDRDYREKGGKFNSLYAVLPIDNQKEEPGMFGNRQIALSAREYGWDGIRFDDIPYKNAELGALRARQRKELLWKEQPGFLFGYNASFSPDAAGPLNHELRECMAGGGCYFQEAIREFGRTPSLRYESWREYVAGELKSAKMVQEAGGTYHGLYLFGHANPARDLYKLIFSLIAGGHVTGGTHEKVPGCSNWGKFMTRASAFLWHQGLQSVPNPLKRVRVEGGDSLLWEPLVQEFVHSGSRKFLVVHLVNPPTTDRIHQTDPGTLPRPVEHVKVHLAPESGTRVVRTAVIRPEAEPYVLEIKAGGTTVAVPQVVHWTMVVAEIEGRFEPSKPIPKFSDPIDPLLVKEPEYSSSDKITSDPLLASRKTVRLAPNEKLFETSTGFNGISGNTLPDKESLGGRAQASEPEATNNYHGMTYMGPFPAGKYRFYAHAKWLQKNKDVHSPVWTIFARSPGNERTVIGKRVIRFDEESASEKKLNTYQFHTMEVDHKNGGFMDCEIFMPPLKSDDCRFVLDYLKVECLRKYSDEEQGAWTKAEKPAGLRKPEGQAPGNVLLVRGLHYKVYGIEQALTCRTTYELPTRYEDVYAHDAVILCNISFEMSSYATRKLYSEYVHDGGRLVVLGGFSTLGQGGMKDTLLEQGMPFRLKGDHEVVAAAAPLLLGAQASTPFSDRPALFWRHDVTLREGAELLAYAGSHPVAARRKVGKGQVAVFAGTVFGEGTAQARPFWECDSWKALARRMILQ